MWPDDALVGGSFHRMETSLVTARGQDPERCQPYFRLKRVPNCMSVTLRDLPNSENFNVFGTVVLPARVHFRDKERQG